MKSPVQSERLEARRLLSLSALGPELLVATPDPTAVDVARTEINGSIIAESYDNGTIVAQRYNNGGELIDERTVATGTTGSDVSVAMDDDGNSVIGYDTVENSVNVVYFVRLSKDGVVSSPVKVAEGSATDEDVRVGGVRVAPGFQGNFFVGYIHDLSRDRHDIKMRYYNAAGMLQGTEWTAGSFVSLFSTLYGFDLDAMESSAAHFSAVFEHSDSLAVDVYYGFGAFNTDTKQGTGGQTKIVGMGGQRFTP